MSLALYRKYRPGTFAEVVGQEHVTVPLANALRSGRIHHAYLFSGPRGCGKTTSARILARALNCERGISPEPCGECDSCVALAPNGPGTLDVIEIDAASHGGVDDARDLRERAGYAPASSRFKIYIIDEAHMVTPQGFNALLKVVEEPPPHLKFIFATTEPDKVITTIRSRTHHYPFRLVPPGALQRLLAELCEREGVVVEKGVLPLVVRAGAGSVRDALSVLDQLIAGSGPDGVSYATALALLGFTDATLLDDTVDALAAGDAAAVFGVVDRVVEAGHDPRRFAADLLERLRDLVVANAVPDAAAVLRDLPPDQFDRLREQAQRFGAAELSRAADSVSAALVEMRGATAPRLQLELMCARLLLPAADSDGGLAARLDRLERRLALGAVPVGPAPVEPAPADSSAAEAAPADSPAAEAAPAVEPATPAPPAQPAAPTPPASGGRDVTAVRRMWPDILDQVKGAKRFIWTLLSGNAQVAAVDANTLTLAMVNAGARDSFMRRGGDEIVRQAIIDVLGVDWKVEAIVDPSQRPASQPTGRAAAGAPAPVPVPAPPRGPAPAPSPAAPEDAGGSPSARPPARGDRAPVREIDDPDELDAESTDADPELSGRALLETTLGAQVIDEVIEEN